MQNPNLKSGDLPKVDQIDLQTLISTCVLYYGIFNPQIIVGSLFHLSTMSLNTLESLQCRKMFKQ